MTNKHRVRDADLEKAHIILGEHGLAVGPAGKTSEAIAKAIGDGIALGRKEGIAKAAEAIARRKDT